MSVKLPLAEAKERLGKYGFSLMSDPPGNNRIWCYIWTGTLVDEYEALRVIEEYENPKPVMDWQI